MALTRLATNAKGEPCRSTSVDESGLCASHAGKGRFGTVEFSRRGGQRSAKARRKRAVAPQALGARLGCLLRREHGRELANSFLTAARKGDWRAAEALMNRIYGRSRETVVNHTPVSPMAPLIASMRLDEKLEILRRLQGGELADTASALPMVEAVPRSP
jgi:hypothetical protein